MEAFLRSQVKSLNPSSTFKRDNANHKNRDSLQPQKLKYDLFFKNPSCNVSPSNSPKNSNLNKGQKQFLYSKQLKSGQSVQPQIVNNGMINKGNQASKEIAEIKARASRTAQDQRKKIVISNSKEQSPVPKKQKKFISVQKFQINLNTQKGKENKIVHHQRGNSYSQSIQSSLNMIGSVVPSRRNSIQYSQNQFNQLKEMNVVQGVSYKSQVGMIPDAPKVNQDSCIVQNFFNKSLTQHFYAVADGHGKCGREVSQFVKQRLPAILQSETQLKENPVSSLRDSILKVSNELTKQLFDVQFSGTTLVSVLIQGKKLYCANVGDSRAVLVRDKSVIALNRDHKADFQDEADRIYKSNGRIMAYKGNHLFQMKKAMIQDPQEFEQKKLIFQDQQ